MITTLATQNHNFLSHVEPALLSGLNGPCTLLVTSGTELHSHGYANTQIQESGRSTPEKVDSYRLDLEYLACDQFIVAS